MSGDSVFNCTMNVVVMNPDILPENTKRLTIKISYQYEVFNKCKVICTLGDLYWLHRYSE